MKSTYYADEVQNSMQILRKAGYQHFIDPKTKTESYILKLTNGYYPRFHLYVEQKNEKISFNLHLDQKKPSYAGTSAHGGEYDGPTVEKEMKRIIGWIASITHVLLPLEQREQASTLQPESEITSEPATESPAQSNTPKKEPFRGIFG